MSTIKYNNKSIKVYSDNDYVGSSLDKRCSSYKKDEPQTLDWIESFDNNSVFYDIGSNIGGFSFIASMIHKNIKIFSFEPNTLNYYSQYKTCVKNKIKNIFPFNLAINNIDEFNYFHYEWQAGELGSKGSFGTELKNQMKKSDYSNPFKRKISFSGATIGVSLDSLVYNFGLDIPDYIKIDVDGNDLLVLEGAKKILHEESIKEIFIEIDDKIYENNEIENFMKKYPYKIKKNINVGTKQKPMRMVLYVRD